MPLVEGIFSSTTQIIPYMALTIVINQVLGNLNQTLCLVQLAVSEIETRTQSVT
jgi:hypothetical protein